ncbi:50S ribosomal protein L25/general stress protein Ctc [Kribbella sp. NPDC051770]|uniref:50S ribosomal protein L25/general stress protein Ctc n=1 Tax=Kribbella sp. NPDC051770 TaxID=3155413 RepID=UPI0034351A96
MAEVKIQAESRTEFGKGAARRIRRDSKVPAVLYGHGSDPVHITLPGHDTMLALKTANALLLIEIEGGESQLALPKQVQRDPIKGFIEHVDLVIVKRGEKVQVEIAVHLEGDAASETLVVLENANVLVEAEATHIPDGVTVSIEGLEAGAQIHASDLKLPAGVELAVEPDTLVVNVTAAATAEQLDAELAEAEAEAGIEKDEAEAPAEEPVAAAAE